MRDESLPEEQNHSAGGRAFILGVVAVVCVLVPVVGDFISSPLAVLALVFGCIGISHYNAGRASRIVPAAVGVVLGVLALFVAVFMFFAMQSPV